MTNEVEMKNGDSPVAVGEMTSADYYKDHYAHFAIHEEMLKDDVRTRAYMNSIIRNKHLFRDKVVLDIGCGTGMMSLFAASAGAKKVIGIDMSAIVERATDIVKENDLDDVITIIKGKVEDVELPDGIEKVDVIISEWMGYCLFYETMLPTVIYARDRWLAEGGIIMPDAASLYVSALEDRKYKEQKVEFWDNVYGFDMSIMKEIVVKEPLIDSCNPNQLVCKRALVKTVDLYTVKIEDLTFETEFSLKAMRNDYVHGLIAYFTVEFTKCKQKIKISTAPHEEYTHWKQTIFYLKDVITVCKGEDIKIKCGMTPNLENKKDLLIKLKVDFDGKRGSLNEENDYVLK
jgi:protein arginine N-methyltransferase 1